MGEAGRRWDIYISLPPLINSPQFFVDSYFVPCSSLTQKSTLNGLRIPEKLQLWHCNCSIFIYYKVATRSKEWSRGSFVMPLPIFSNGMGWRRVACIVVLGVSLLRRSAWNPTPAETCHIHIFHPILVFFSLVYCWQNLAELVVGILLLEEYMDEDVENSNLP